jgi:hypothetical protein
MSVKSVDSPDAKNHPSPPTTRAGQYAPKIDHTLADAHRGEGSIRSAVRGVESKPLIERHGRSHIGDGQRYRADMLDCPRRHRDQCNPGDSPGHPLPTTARSDPRRACAELEFGRDSRGDVEFPAASTRRRRRQTSRTNLSVRRCKLQCRRGAPRRRENRCKTSQDKLAASRRLRFLSTDVPFYRAASHSWVRLWRVAARLPCESNGTASRRRDLVRTAPRIARPRPRPSRIGNALVDNSGGSRPSTSAG